MNRIRTIQPGFHKTQYIFLYTPFQGENLDGQQGVIDFSLYLRNKIDGDAASPKSVPSEPQNNDAKSMNAVLDQKSYVEELNRRLK